jgi:hypothetical protein
MLSRLRSFVDILARRDRFERQMGEEMQLHLELRAADLERGGLPRSASARAPGVWRTRLRQGRLSAGTRSTTPRRADPGCSLRLAVDDPNTGIYGRRDSVPRARHWCEHRHLQPDRCGFDSYAATCGRGVAAIVAHGTSPATAGRKLELPAVRTIPGADGRVHRRDCVQCDRIQGPDLTLPILDSRLRRAEVSGHARHVDEPLDRGSPET